MKKFVLFMLSGILFTQAFGLNLHAAENKITHVEAESIQQSEASKAIDNDINSIFRTPSVNHTDAHRRFIDFKFDGLYELDLVKIFNELGSYNHYQIYVSETGQYFEKVAFKNNDEMPTVEGDSYDLKGVVASQVRINLSYNSSSMTGNLAEVEFYGTRVGDAETYTEGVKVEDFSTTDYATELQKMSEQSYSDQKTTQELSALVGRVLGEKYKNNFVFEVMENKLHSQGTFELSDLGNDKILIKGTDGVAMASGFNYYLKYFCNAVYNPLFSSQLDMPSELPKVGTAIVKETQYEHRYALNFCTYSYTMAFWGWEDFEKFLDWAAMSGINLVLDIVGQEEVVRQTLNEFGYSDEEVKQYISGPGYFAWYYMQNMTGFGGPLPDDFFEQRVELGRQMHDRMLTFGMKPVLSGFSGMVPTSFKEKHPDAATVAQGTWCGYQRPDMLRTYRTDGGRDYFAEVADVFYEKQRDIYGDVTHFYAVDPFHEGGQIGDMNVSTVYGTIQDKMLEHDEDAIWIIQEWSGSMNNSKVNGLTNKEQALILDLFSEISPRNDVMENNEVPWVWNMLHNFGGRMGIDGNLDKLIDVPNTFSNKKYMRGIGMTPEAIENSPVVYDLLWDLTWTSDLIDLTDWVNKYAERNYGGTNEDVEKVWDILLDTAYAEKDYYYQGGAESVINARPSKDISSASTWGHSKINYDKEEFEKAAQLLVENYDEFKDSPSFEYDYITILEQVISNSAQELHREMISAYDNQNITLFNKTSNLFLEMIEDLDELTSYNENLMVGKWIQESRSMLEDMDDWNKDLFEFNARALITTWGGERNANNGGLKDYSNRQWSGLTKDYYLPRWEHYISNLRTSLETGSGVSNTNWFMMEWKWANRKSDEGFEYASTPNTDGKLSDVGTRIMAKYKISDIKELVGELSDAQENIALNKDVKATYDAHTEVVANNLTDGDAGTSWFSDDVTQKVEFTLDLELEAHVSGMEILLKQAAGEYRYAYVVEVLENGVWKQVAQDDSFSLTSQVKVDYKGKAEKIRYTFDIESPEIVEVAELIVYGSYGSANLVNYALEATASAQHNQEDAKNINDGNENTQWVSNNGAYPTTLTLMLPEERQIDLVEYIFEKAGPYFQYQIVGIDEHDQEFVILDKSDSQDPVSKNNKVPVNKVIKGIKFTFTGRLALGEFYGAWPVMKELRLLGPEIVSDERLVTNVALHKVTTVTSNLGIHTTDLVTDGNRDNLYVVQADTWPNTFEIDLDGEFDISQVNVFFEKAGLRFQYSVEAVQSDGSKVMVKDMSDNTEDLDAYYELPTNTLATRLIVTLHGKAAGGNASLAWPAIAEIEVFASPINAAQEATLTSDKTLDLTKLTDEEETEGLEFNEDTQITFTYPKRVDITGFEIVNVGQSALDIEVEALIGEEWKTIYENIGQAPFMKYCNSEFNSVLSDTFRVTVKAGSTISEVRLFKTNVRNELVGKIDRIIANIDKQKVGQYPGEYDETLRDETLLKIQEIKDAISYDLNSEETNPIYAQVKELEKQFLRSYIVVDKSKLISEILDVSYLLDEALIEGNEDLTFALNEATKVKNEFKVTQAEIDATYDNLVAQKEIALSLLSELEKLDAVIKLADKFVSDVIIDNADGAYTQEDIDAFKVIIDEKRLVLDSEDEEEIKLAVTTLTEALEAVKNKAIVIDRETLKAALSDLVVLTESNYTRDSFATYEALVDEVKVLLDKDSITQAELDTLLAKVETFNNGLVTLDRTGLENLIKQAEILREDLYSKESYAVLKEAIELAKTILENESLNQDEIDVAITALKDIIDDLDYVEVDVTRLTKLIELAKSLDSRKYTKESYDNMLIKLEVAKDVLTRATNNNQTRMAVTKAEVENSANDLEKAINGLVLKEDDGETTKPETEEPGTVKPNPGGSTKDPSTGINTNNVLYMGMMAVSILGLAVTLLNRKKKQDN